MENRISQLNPKSKIYIAGHNGMVGSAIRRKLTSKGYVNLLGFDSSEVEGLDESYLSFDMLQPNTFMLQLGRWYVMIRKRLKQK